MTPRVSIGVPVYNGAKYLAEALDSLLAQTFEDLEIIISDNASTDETGDIARAYAKRDARVRYERSDRNHGAAWNFNRAAELARGEYFKWTAHDDVCAPEFVSRSVEVLDRDPSTVLCYSKLRIIDETGAVLSEYPVKLNTDSDSAPERFAEIVRGYIGHLCYEVFGVLRTGALRTTPMMGNYAHGDGVLLAWLALLGRFYEIPEPLLFFRRHPEQSMSAMPDRYAYTGWFDSRRRGKLVLPNWRYFGEYVRSVRGVPLAWRRRARCYLHVVRSGISHRRKLARDLRVAVAWALSGPPRKRNPGRG